MKRVWHDKAQGVWLVLVPTGRENSWKAVSSHATKAAAKAAAKERVKA